MKIECLLRRSGGSHVSLGGTEYHFAPDTDGRHVADVADEDHIDRFLSIPEGYRLLRASTAPVAPAVDEAPPAAVLPAGGAITPVAEPLVLDVAAFLGKPAEKTDDETASERDAVVASEALNRDALAIEYLKHFGRKPHHKWSAEKISDELREAGAI